ncbi:MAG: hypothetical protein WD801_00365 [Gemmatimonadaceae bacterium]
MRIRRPPRADYQITPTPIVVGADVIMDLVGIGGRRGNGAEELFEAIAADVESGTMRVPAWISPLTVPLLYHLSDSRPRSAVSFGVVQDLLRLVRVAPLDNMDYLSALYFSDVDFEDAIQFVACRRVGARYFVTSKHFDVKRAPAERRTPMAVAPLFRAASREAAANEPPASGADISFGG